MFEGQIVNLTEEIPTLHTALRGSSQQQLKVNSNNVNELVKDTVSKISKFSDGIRKGTIKTQLNNVLKNVIVLGSSGSQLGIEFVHEAIR